ncbi:MAG TPA: phosphoribosylanthranilate isomerase [Candidatus Polarisedimenticolaceae bacterium]|nr:phosphoribosylanthranilate isomerase [Candidatus Polarisedimenticolaceae bacterium]
MTRRVIVKVCGITEERDAHEAVHLGVDALGFDFRPDSPRYVELDLVRSIVERIPSFVTTVGVFADAPLIRVMDTVRAAGISLIQFHGDESPATCQAVAPHRWIKALRVGRDFHPEQMSLYPGTTYLLDARREPGSSAPPPDWRKVRTWSAYGRLVLGGDFELGHVAMMLDDARPYGLDVLSEIEVAPGKKDLDRLELLIDAVRRAERRMT